MGKILQTVPEAAETLNTVLVVHTLDEAAAILRVRKSWLERQAAARKIPFTMLGGAYRFTDAHLAEIVHMNDLRLGKCISRAGIYGGGGQQGPTQQQLASSHERSFRGD